MKERSLELTVGVFVVLALAILSFMVIRFGSYEYRESTYPVTAVFSFTNGVIEGAPVRLAGVEVGKVEKLVLSEQEEFGVHVHMQVQEKAVIREDARVVINSLGIMGEKYVEFLPVSTTARVVQPGESIRGVDPVALSQIFEDGKAVAQQVQNMLAGWADKETAGNIKATINNMARITDEETQVALKGTLNNLNEVSGSPNKENISEAIVRFREFSNSAGRVFGQLDVILAENGESLKQVGPKLNTLLDSMNKIITDVEGGEGTIGKLVKDESIHSDIKAFVADIKANPWKLFFKTDEKKPGGKEKKKGGFLFF